MSVRNHKRIDEDAHDRQAPEGRTVYRAIYREGMEELSRDSGALAWSGLAAGLSMGCSLLTEALLHAHLPDAGWRPLVAKLGYAVGFLLVILGRQQLFTENTLTVILPLLRVARLGLLRNVLRLWAVVFVSNIIGTAMFAAAIVFLPVLEPQTLDAVVATGFKALEPGFWGIFARALFAGWLIALMVWLLPYAETARVSVIIIITYLVGVAGFSHVIAGSTTVFALAAHGDIGWVSAFLQFTIPSLIGNTIGGVGLVGALSHAQFVEGQDANL